MKLFFLAVIALTSLYSSAQEPVPNFKKYAVLETGCSYYLPDSTLFEMSLSEDGAKVITGEVIFGDFFFSTITVQFVEGTISSENDKKGILEGYLGHLKEVLEIAEFAGLGWGHTLDSDPNAVGVIDYWADAEGTKFAVKGWCNDSFLAVLMVYGNSDYPYLNAQQMFLDGIRFPQNKR